MLHAVRICKAFRYRVYPTPEQIVRLAAWDNALRFLWNLALEQRRIGLSRCGGDKRYPTAFDQMLELTPLRAELPWLADVPRGACDQLLVDLEKAWQRCFQRLARAPRFKRKVGNARGLYEPHPKKWRLDGSALRFPKLGSMRAVIHRPLEGKPKTCTLKRDGDQWFASIVCEIDGSAPVPRTEPAVALDRGVVNVIADSDGRVVEAPRFYAAAMKRLARAQRNVSRKKKGSKNREKAKVRAMRIHRKVRRQREHFIHGLSHDYAKSHGIVVVEKLQIGNMTRSAAGAIDKPGRKVAQKSGLNRSILDSGWGMLVEQLRYKTAERGGSVVEVSAVYSSQTCHGCGHVDAESRRAQARFVCTGCGLVEHADVNAAKVLLQRFKTPGNPWCLPVDGSACKGPGRSRKRLRTSRRSSESSAPKGES